jgi:hypothetical protein
MVAALLRVLNSGIQDSRLLAPKGQPNVALFSTVLIRAGRFTTQWVRLDFDTNPTFGNSAVITLPRKGHLISRLYLVTTFPDIFTAQAGAAAAAEAKPFLGPAWTWTNSLGHALINTATIDIGGSRVERIDGRLLEVLDEFYTPLEKVPLVNGLIQRNMTNFPVFNTSGSVTPLVTYTPLPFWFSRGDPGVFLPIDALAVDPVKLTIAFNPAANLVVSTGLAANYTEGAGSRYFPIEGAPLYVADPNGKPVYGLPASPGAVGDPAVAVLASAIPNVAMPRPLLLKDTYVMAEYIYLDAPEANRFRISDIEVPVTQHYAFDPKDTSAASMASLELRVPNPTRNILFYANRYEAPSFNAPFLATRDLSGTSVAGATQTSPIWWPNATNINPKCPSLLQPAFVFSGSEPLKSVQLTYEGSLYRYSTLSPSIFRSLLPSSEMRKSPYVNRYMYSLHFGLNHGHLDPSYPCGEANLDKITSIALDLEFKPFAGSSYATSVPRYIVWIWAETYNIFRVYAGRGGMMFAY